MTVAERTMFTPKDKTPEQEWLEAAKRADRFQFTGNFEDDAKGIFSLRSNEFSLPHIVYERPLNKVKTIDYAREQMEAGRGAVRLIEAEIAEKQLKGHYTGELVAHADFMRKEATLLEQFVEKYN